jgi:hypothetical protein
MFVCVPVMAWRAEAATPKTAISCPAQGAGGFPSVFHFAASIPDKPVVHRELGTAGIQALSGWKSSRAWQNPGLTKGSHELKTDFRLSGQQRTGTRGACVWVEDLTVIFRYTELEVFVSRDYADGSCEARQILAHEMDHVAVHRRAFLKYKASLERRLSNMGLPTPRSPGRYASMNEAQRIIGDKLQKATTGLYDAFKRELIVGNAALDTPQNYKAIQKRCRGWK